MTQAPVAMAPKQGWQKGEKPGAPPVPKAVKPSPAPTAEPAWKSPTLGLAKRRQQEPEVETSSGNLSESSQERSYVRDESDRIIGQQETSSHSVGAGVKGSRTTGGSTFDGTTETDVGTELEGFAGAEAAVKLVQVATRDELSVAVETMARAGAFGKAAQHAAVKRGMASASIESSIEGGAGIAAELVAKAKVDRSGLIPALEAMIEAGIKIGAWFDAEAKAEARFGPMVAMAMAKVSAFAGAQAEFSARAFASREEGVGAEFSSEAFAGVKGSASGSVQVDVGVAALEVAGEIEGVAGANVQASGGLSISLSGVSGSFEASAFAGVQGKASGSASFKLMGKRILHVSGTIKVSAGAGVEAEGEFTVQNGKVAFSAEFAATLGLGGGAGIGIEIDAGALADIVIAELQEMARGDEEKTITSEAPDYQREPIADPLQAAVKQQVGYEAVYDDFVAYANKKAMQGEHGVKKEKVQEIIARVAPHIRADLAFVETDMGIRQAALDAFGGQLKDIVVQRGYIRGFQPVPQAEAQQFKERMQAEEKWREARDGLQQDFDAYSGKKAGQGKSGIKKAEVQKLIDKHWKKLTAAFPGAEADQVVMFAAQAMKDQYLDDFTVSGGQIVQFEAPESKAAQAKQGVKDAKADATRQAAMTKARAALGGYRAKLIANPKEALTSAGVNKVLTSALSSIKGRSGEPAINSEIRQLVMEVLDGLVTGVQVESGRVTGMAFQENGLSLARQGKQREDISAAQKQAVDAFSAAMTAYKEQKVAGGKNGIKKQVVQERLDKAAKKVAHWKTTPEGSAAFSAAASAALTPFLTKITITDGVIGDFDVADMAGAKEQRRTDGKAVLGERDSDDVGTHSEDNARRRMVADALRNPLKRYELELRQANKPGAKKPKKASAVDLQKLIDKGVKQFRADVNNEVGDAAIVDAITLYLPMVTHVDVQGLTIRSLTENSAYYAEARDRRELGLAVQEVTSDIAGELKGVGKGLSQPLVQVIINKYRPKLSGLPAGEADSVLELAVQSGLSDRVEEINIEDGKITEFRLTSPIQIGGHR
jgi:hypothetical protein